MTDDPLIAAFFEEAAELLSDFEAGLLQLEETPDDPDLLNRIFRSAHTLKGNSSMLGFEEIARFTHALEDLLDQLRKGRRVVTPRVVDTLLASEDVVRSLLGRARAGGAAASSEEAQTVERVLGALRALLDGQEPVDVPERAPVATPPPPPPTGERMLYEIEFRPPADLFGRGLDPMQVLQDLENLGEVVQVSLLTDGLPSLAEMDPERCYLGWRIWLMSTAQRALVESRFDFVADAGAVKIDALEMGGGDPPATDASSEDAEPAGTAAPAEPAPPPAVRETPGTAPTAGAAPGAPSPAPAATEPRRAAAAPVAAESTTIRVPVEKVDRLINLVGELVITQSMVAQAASDFSIEKLAALQSAVSQMDRHARELHERMMAVRMLPIKTLFARFPRLVRDLTSSAGKSAVLEMSGEETELDKTVIEKIGDPLTHLVRNAVDHGLEMPDVRRAAGKPEQGRLGFKAYQQGGNIYIEVSDDGKGLDRDKIHTKARDLGLAGDEPLTDEQVFGLIFRAGFSTADKITEVSGRGVGMDVVRQNVEALGGSIAISSERGKGTTFRIKLPLTLAILDGQLLSIGAQCYVLPIASIVESIRPVSAAITTVFGRGETVTVRGQAVPVIRLCTLLGVEPRTTDLTRALVVIVEHEGHLAALGVDELLGQQQVVIKSLEQNFQKADGVAGATILGDGRVALILDVPGLVALARDGRRFTRSAPMVAALEA
jgi:two-component system chemotaxis sensor kinase CheA